MNWWDALRQRVGLMFSGKKFLCDTCKYNYGSACLRPERPNAALCPDYRKR